ncbi:MAG TPA: AmmeMemoRadiSam system protein B [Candidatus Omnitrophica bacterium]|nr:AmmeMemoRadiSam system protein B [Candidatus Omnitrophota bacterium]
MKRFFQVNEIDRKIKRVLMASLYLSILLNILTEYSIVVFADEDIREPAVSGRFYPQRKEELKEMIENFLNEVDRRPLNGEIVAFVASHAGYIYSGSIGAYVYRQLKGRRFDTVVLIDSSHYVGFRGISVGNFKAYRTPLGSVRVDRELATKLIASGGQIRFYPPSP